METLESETVRKGSRAYLNLFSMLLQRKLGVKKVRGYPFILTLDPSSVCQLRCPFCPTGSQKGAFRDMTLMSLELFQKIIDEVAPYVFRLDMYNWGEPLLNKHFVDLVRYAKQRRIWVSTSTNLSVQLSDQQVEDLLRSGLDKMIVSLDGVSEEKYMKYRIGGNFNLIMSNLQRLAQKKRELGLERPVIVWQFLVFRYNEEDIETAKQMASDMGVKLKLGAPFVYQEEQWIDMTPTLDEFNLYRQLPAAESQPETSAKSRRCDWLYSSAAINANGSVSPCCVVPVAQDDFGRLAGGDFKHVYNNEKYQAARALFTGQANGHTAIICDHCPWPSQQSMLDWVPPLIVAQNPFLHRVIGRVRQTLSH
jgi:MoaA/NifB/PqqE/SkfB family radical SAM enzyme